MQKLNNFSLMADTMPDVVDQFNDVFVLLEGLGLYLSALVMILTLFMLIVSFTQKMRGLQKEQGVLRAIGLN